MNSLLPAVTGSWDPFCPSESCELDLPGPWTPGRGGRALVYTSDGTPPRTQWDGSGWKVHVDHGR